jgi:hypothetical protein
VARVWQYADGMATSIAELQAAGIRFEADEAVAITQQLIHSICHREPEEVTPPYGPPAPHTVLLKEDGSVVCTSCATAPAVLEVGAFLETILPDGSPRVPGSLRYTMARALLSVDVPPFASLDDLSLDLARHEHGGRADRVRAVLERAATRGLVLSPSFLDRRKSRTSATTLRRELRAAEVRLYEHQTRRAAPPVPPRTRTTTAAVACVAAGLMLVATGEYMHQRQVAPVSEATALAPAAPQSGPPAPLAPVVEPHVVQVSTTSASSLTRSGSPRPEVRRISTRRTGRPATATTVRQPAPKPHSRSVLDRLRLGWLRNAFSSHSEL